MAVWRAPETQIYYNHRSGAFLVPLHATGVQRRTGKSVDSEWSNGVVHLDGGVADTRGFRF